MLRATRGFRELDKATVPMYQVEPPDVLTIDVVQQVSQSSHILQAGDTVVLTVTGTFPEEPIAGEFLMGLGVWSSWGIRTSR